MSTLRGASPVAGVVGWPVSHSLSPAMMTCWLDAAELDGTYGAFPVAPEMFETAMRALPALGMSGVNVTAPHKTQALDLADTASEAARRLGAANLLTVTAQGGLHADNTDLEGMRGAISAMDGAQLSAPAVLIGAGGAARAALLALSETPASALRIVNRTPENAQRLADALELDAEIFPLRALGDALDGAGVVVNASSAAPDTTPDLKRLDPDGGVIEMTYAPLDTTWMIAARRAERAAVDGLVMLIAQARPSFNALFGAPAPDGAKVDMDAFLRAAQREREAGAC